MQDTVLTEHDRDRAMSNAILAQCAGTLTNLLFKNGFMLAYLSAQNVASNWILILLTIPDMLVFMVTIPSAYQSDRMGRKKMGLAGLSGTVAGFALISISSLLPAVAVMPVFVIGAICFGAGNAAFMSSWFALLSPIIPENLRGRFFGRLRTSWQAVAIVFSFAVAAALNACPGLVTFRMLLLLITMMAALRMLFYARIPEVEKPSVDATGLMGAMGEVMRVPGYMPFCAYVFLITLFTGACPWLFGLLQKDSLGFTGDKLVLMGNLLAIGTLTGFTFAGRLVDRFGTKPVFLVNHFAYAVILFLFPLRACFHLSTAVTVGGLCFLFGICTAAGSIAVSTEMLGIIPARNKALSTAFVSTLVAAGASMSGILSARILALGVLTPEWRFGGSQAGVYDTMLLGCGIMILLLVVTLGLIPSVMRPAQWVPHGGQT